MTDAVKKALIGVAALAVLALGAAAIADAASNDNGSAAQSSTSAGERSGGGQRSDEALLTGDTATKVREAALAEVSGGTIERVETDADGHAAYEAHMLASDGSRVTVYVNEQFEVVDVESGR